MTSAGAAPDLTAAADVLGRAADWLEHLAKQANPGGWEVKAKHGRDVTGEGWSTLHVVGADGVLLADCTPVIDDDVLWVEAEARAQHIAAADPLAVAALVPALRRAARNVERTGLGPGAQLWAWERDLVEFARRVLREEDQ